MTELHELTLLEAAAAVRDRQVSPTELVQHALDRASAHEAVGAFAELTPELALTRAAGEPRGPLWGVPTAEKDLFSTAGVPTRLGSRAFADHVPTFDDHSVRLVAQAGLISIGKTSTPELGLPCYTEPDEGVGGTARTPWDLSRSAGGSSGGAAAAVAAGIVPMATASDGGGSIRIPAAACGLVGFKPSRGLVSNGPLPGWSMLGVRGVETRTVRDTAAMLDVLAVPFAGDAWTSPAQGTGFLAACGTDPGRLRVGVITQNVLDAPVHPACLAAVDRAARLLEGLGHEVTPDVPMLPFDGMYESFIAVWCTGAAGAVVPPEREELLRPLTRALRERGRELSALDLASAITTLNGATVRGLEATAAYDVLLMPSLAQLPAPVGALRNDAEPWTDMWNQGCFTPYTSQLNVTGQPAVSLPLHWHEDGGVLLPVGITLAGRPHADRLLVALAAQVEAADPWAERRPPIW